MAWANVHNQPGNMISPKPSNRAITSPNPNTNRRRRDQSLMDHSSIQATGGHASCGLIVASASNTPPQNRLSLATQAADPASDAATSKLSCFNLIPCTVG